MLGLPTGSIPIGVYRELVRMKRAGELSFRNVVTFKVDEYVGLTHEHDQSYRYIMNDNFFDHLVDMKPENIHILNGITDNPKGECVRYEEEIASYGMIDLFTGCIGVDGQLAFSEPNTSLSSRTGVRRTDRRYLQIPPRHREKRGAVKWLRSKHYSTSIIHLQRTISYSSPTRGKR